MQGFIVDWLNLALRWLHVIVAIAWIGESFYFVALDNSLKPAKDPAATKRGVFGELWHVHGGGFYNMQKYTVAPENMPEDLHWSKWPSYTTWMSGFGLFMVLYLFSPSTYLIDKNVLDMGPVVAVSSALGFLLAGWIVYDSLCRAARESRPVAGHLCWRLRDHRGVVGMSCVRWTRRLSDYRRDACHDHVGERVFRDHPRPAQDGRCHAQGPGAQCHLWQARQAAFGAQHLFHVAGGVRDAVESLRDDLHASV